MLTRKDFNALAARLLDERPCDLGAYPFKDAATRAQYDQWGTTTLAIVEWLATTNPRFDRARFIAACGMGQ